MALYVLHLWQFRPSMSTLTQSTLGVPRVIFFWLWGAKTATDAKLKGSFCSFYS